VEGLGQEMAGADARKVGKAQATARNGLPTRSLRETREASGAKQREGMLGEQRAPRREQ